MRSYLRRFVYLVVDGQRPCTLDLHRIDMSRFFRSLLIGATVDARLPRPSMTFYAPSSEDHSGQLQFLLLDRNKVLATDQMGHAAIYDAGMNALRTAPTLSRPKYNPISVAVGHKLYVLDSSRIVVGAGEKEHCLRHSSTSAADLTAAGTMTGATTLFLLRPTAPVTSTPMLWSVARTCGCLRRTRAPTHSTRCAAPGPNRESGHCHSVALPSTFPSTSSGLASPPMRTATFSVPSTSLPPPGGSRPPSHAMSGKTSVRPRDGSRLHPHSCTWAPAGFALPGFSVIRVLRQMMMIKMMMPGRCSLFSQPWRWGRAARPAKDFNWSGTDPNVTASETTSTSGCFKSLKCSDYWEVRSCCGSSLEGHQYACLSISLSAQQFQIVAAAGLPGSYGEPLIACHPWPPPDSPWRLS